MTHCARSVWVIAQAGRDKFRLQQFWSHAQLERRSAGVPCTSVQTFGGPSQQNPTTINTAHDICNKDTLSMQHASCGKPCQQQQPCQPQGLTRVHAAAHGRSPAPRL